MGFVGLGFVWLGSAVGVRDGAVVGFGLAAIELAAGVGVGVADTRLSRLGAAWLAGI